MSYGGDVDRGYFLDTFNWVFNVIALVAVALRLISRLWTERQRWDLGDGFIVFAMAVNLARAVFVSVCINRGFGKHFHVLLAEDPAATVSLGRLLIILQAIGLWTFTLPKLPVAALLVRIFGTRKRIVPIVLYSLVAVQILLASLLTVFTFVQCKPVEKNWNPLLRGTCWNPHVVLNLGYLVGAYSAALDLAFGIYPIVQVWKLQMDFGRKILIAASLSLGIVAAITTIYKLTTIASLLNKGDPTFATIPLEIWNSVEGTALLVAAAVPLTRPLLMALGSGFIAITSRLTSRPSQSGSKSFELMDDTGASQGSQRRDTYARYDVEMVSPNKSIDQVPLRHA